MAAWRLAAALAALLCALDAAGLPALSAAQLIFERAFSLQVFYCLSPRRQRLYHPPPTPPQACERSNSPGPCPFRDCCCPCFTCKCGCQLRARCLGAGAATASWGGTVADWSGVPVLDVPLANPHAVLAANRQQLGLNARNIYAVASPVRKS